MSQNTYRCAFHPQQIIFNFCKSSTCFLPMCPLCIKIHSQQHKNEKTHGDYDSISGILNQIEGNIKGLEKIITRTGQQFSHNYEIKKRNQIEIKKKIMESRNKCLMQIERYFQQIQSSLIKSLSVYNENTIDQFNKLDQQMNELKNKFKITLEGLYSQKALKTIIIYYVNNNLKAWQDRVQKVQHDIMELQKRNVSLLIDNEATHQIMTILDRFITLNYENYVQNGFYSKQYYSKAKSINTSRLQKRN